MLSIDDKEQNKTDSETRIEYSCRITVTIRRAPIVGKRARRTLYISAIVSEVADSCMVPLRLRPFLMRWTDFWLQLNCKKVFFVRNCTVPQPIQITIKVIQCVISNLGVRKPQMPIV